MSRDEREGSVDKLTAKHGTEMRLWMPKEGWVRLIRESEDEDGSPLRIWFDLREEDLLELADALRVPTGTDA